MLSLSTAVLINYSQGGWKKWLIVGVTSNYPLKILKKILKGIGAAEAFIEFIVYLFTCSNRNPQMELADLFQNLILGSWSKVTQIL